MVGRQAVPTLSRATAAPGPGGRPGPRLHLPVPGTVPLLVRPSGLRPGSRLGPLLIPEKPILNNTLHRGGECHLVSSSFFLADPDRLRLREADRPDLDLAGDLLRLRLCLLSDLLLRLRDRVRDLDRDRLRLADLFFFLQCQSQTLSVTRISPHLESSIILILRPLSSVSSNLSIAFCTSSNRANSTTPSFLRDL